MGVFINSHQKQPKVSKKSLLINSGKLIDKLCGMYPYTQGDALCYGGAVPLGRNAYLVNDSLSLFSLSK